MKKVLFNYSKPFVSSNKHFWNSWKQHNNSSFKWYLSIYLMLFLVKYSAIGLQILILEWAIITITGQNETIKSKYVISKKRNLENIFMPAAKKTLKNKIQVVKSVKGIKFYKYIVCFLIQHDWSNTHSHTI